MPPARSRRRPLRVVQVCSELAPFSKTGGLGDAVAALSQAVARSGNTVLVVTPRYASIDLKAIGARDTGVRLALHAGRHRHDVAIYRLGEPPDPVIFFVDHPVFHRGGLYGDYAGAFGDNHFRFALLCRAALEAVRRVPVGSRPLGEDVVFHAHDWQAALTPIFLEALYRPLGIFAKAASVLTIHNLAHQGWATADRFGDLDLAPRWFEPWSLEHKGNLNLLKGGLLHAEQITTVSPSFAEEIRTPEGGFGLDWVLRLRQNDLTGVLNGIDTDTWNPATDPYIEANYDASDMGGKAVCKAALQATLGLPMSPRTPIVGSVGRLDPQKGVELFLDSIPWLVEEQGAQVVVLGSAQPSHQHYEHTLRHLEGRYPRHVRAWIGYSEAKAHQIEAGADLFAMPSRFEPCGLNQMYSLRYGTLPVVRRTGGLADSVVHATPEGTHGTGWLFNEYSAFALRNVLWQALDTYRKRPEAFAAIRARGMATDFTWDASVPIYTDVYERALARRA